jgi:hypothetical protein
MVEAGAIELKELGLHPGKIGDIDEKQEGLEV